MRGKTTKINSQKGLRRQFYFVVIKQYIFGESALLKSVRAEVSIPKYPVACCGDRNVSLPS